MGSADSGRPTSGSELEGVSQGRGGHSGAPVERGGAENAPPGKAVVVKEAV
jgi:hypothetical protein